MSEGLNHDRRRFFGTAALTIGAASLGMFDSVVQRVTSAGRQLPVEGEMPSLARATGWINSQPCLRAVCVIQPSRAEQAFRTLGLPKNGAKRRPLGSTYASAMKDPGNPLKVAAQFGVHNLTRDEIAALMPHFPLPPLL